MPGNFIDTNVLIYLASSDPVRAARAETIISGGGTISVQVLNELANVARRKMRLSWKDTRAFLSMVRGLLLVSPLTTEIHENGLALAERYKLSIYDAMIVASALHADCDVLWSEDMQDGMTIAKRLRVVNPFVRTKPK
ncbi:MAG: PIN domain-containing protein [Candidatus Binataceae bacterium]